MNCCLKTNDNFFMTPEIRFCKREDFSEIVHLLRQLWPNKELDVVGLQLVFERALISSNQKLTVAILDNRIVGYCSLTIKNNFWQAGYVGNVDELVVDAGFRKNGIGKILMVHAEELARQHQCKLIELDSSFHRKEAHRFYENIGFKSRAYLFTKPLTS